MNPVGTWVDDHDMFLFNEISLISMTEISLISKLIQ